MYVCALFFSGKRHGNISMKQGVGTRTVINHTDTTKKNHVNIYHFMTFNSNLSYCKIHITPWNISALPSFAAPNLVPSVSRKQNRQKQEAIDAGKYTLKSPMYPLHDITV